MQEIGRRPDFSVDVDFPRESHSLAAGLAFGMVVLGKGTNSRALGSSTIELLFKYVNGGQYEHTEDHRAVHRVKENDAINTDVTAPGAIVALALMFIRSNDASINARLAVENTTVRLELP